MRSADMEPMYVKAMHSGLLGLRVAEARARLSSCDLCPRACGVDRLAGEKGVCRGGATAEISSAGPHYGEEPPLVGRGGSGTVFLTHCNLRCIFCQNFDISHQGKGLPVTPEEMAGSMLELQRRGCHNINFVTPTHFLPQILEALQEAAAAGLRLPLVWNCGGYESVPSLRLLEGIVDIYMPDMKFADPEPAERYCGAPDYFSKARAAILEMHRQVGDLIIDEYGLARRGLLVRHLVMPGGLSGTGEVVRFLSREISRDTYVNIMDQYRPCFEAGEYPEICRPIRSDEYESARDLAHKEGLQRGFV